MLPLSYAMLRHLICCDEACADDIMTALAGEYASFSAFTKPHVQEALMTAEKNGLITESHLDLDAEGELCVLLRQLGTAQGNQRISWLTRGCGVPKPTGAVCRECFSLVSKMWPAFMGKLMEANNLFCRLPS